MRVIFDADDPEDTQGMGAGTNLGEGVCGLVVTPEEMVTVVVEDPQETIVAVVIVVALSPPPPGGTVRFDEGDPTMATVVQALVVVVVIVVEDMPRVCAMEEISLEGDGIFVGFGGNSAKKYGGLCIA